MSNIIAIYPDRIVIDTSVRHEHIMGEIELGYRAFFDLLVHDDVIFGGLL